MLGIRPDGKPGKRALLAGEVWNSSVRVGEQSSEGTTVVQRRCAATWEQVGGPPVSRYSVGPRGNLSGTFGGPMVSGLSRIFTCPLP